MTVTPPPAGWPENSVPPNVPADHAWTAAPGQSQYGQPQYGQPQYGQYGAPAPVPLPTTAARFGKIGFWILLGTMVVVIVGSIVQLSMVNQAFTGLTEMSETGELVAPTTDPLLLSFFNLGLTTIPWIGLLAATGLGVFGLIRRERPVWWSIVAVSSIVIYFFVSGALGILTLIIVIPGLSAL